MEGCKSEQFSVIRTACSHLSLFTLSPFPFTFNFRVMS